MRFTVRLVSNGNVLHEFEQLLKTSGLFNSDLLLTCLPPGFSDAATYEDLANGECTSCAVAQDKSAYWAPVLYFKHADGSFEEVQQVGGMLA